MSLDAHGQREPNPLTYPTRLLVEFRIFFLQISWLKRNRDPPCWQTVQSKGKNLDRVNIYRGFLALKMGSLEVKYQRKLTA